MPRLLSAGDGQGQHSASRDVAVCRNAKKGLEMIGPRGVILAF